MDTRDPLKVCIERIDFEEGGALEEFPVEDAESATIDGELASPTETSRDVGLDDALAEFA